MDAIIKKPDYKIMHVIFNQCVRLNFSKTLFTVFLFMIIGTLLCVLPVSVAFGASGASGAEPSFAGVVAAFVLSVAFCIVLFMMLYGMFCVTARMVQKKKVTVGWLFIAFRKKDLRIPISSAVFTALYILLGFLCTFLYFFVVRKTGLGQPGGGTLDSMMCLLAITSAVFLAAFIPLSFVHLILYYYKNVKALGAFALSLRILWGQMLHFVGFVLYAAGTSLIGVVLLSVALAFIPQTSGTSLGILAMFLSILRLFEYYKVLSRVLIAVPVYFFFTVGAIQVYKSDYVPPSPDEEKPEEVQ